MAYLAPHFQYDAFVSYSHGDPGRTGDSPLKSWTNRLVADLTSEILAVDPEFDQLSIWHDEQIDPTSDLTEGLREHIRSSGILIIVMSPRYLKSRWCTDELGWFREQIQDRSRDQGRVFVVRQLPTNEAEWPDFLRDQRGNAPIGFRFHDPQSSMPYGWRGIQDADKDFVQELWRLQTALTKRLRELRLRLDTRAPVAAAAAIAPAAAAPPAMSAVTVATAVGAAPADIAAAPAVAPSGRIYLHARAGDASVAGDVQRRLKPLGINLMSTGSGAGHELADWVRESKARFELAKRCDALALVRPDSDDRFVGDLLDIGVDERERIQAARGAPLPCAVFDRSGADFPIDVSPYGIKRFDLASTDWDAAFTAWLRETRIPRPGAA
jgi:hypothetical protein